VSSSRQRLLSIALLILGLGLVFQPEIASRFALVPTGPSDIRLIGYLLEHGYRWISGDALHAHVWNAPFLYPLPNVTAFTETFLGAAPLYWWPRAIGLAPAVALDLWMMQAMALDFIAFVCFARWNLRASWLAASAGAYLFAFAAIRVNQLGHGQLLPHFFVLMALHGIWTVFSPDRSAVRGVAWLTAGTVLQFYAGFYLAWFWILGLSIALVIALAMPSARHALQHAVPRLRTRATLAVIVAGVLALAPLAWHSVLAARELGLRPYTEVAAMIPRWRSWLDVGPVSWLYGGIYRWLHLAALPAEWEHRIGPGLATAGFVAYGFWKARRQTPLRLIAWSALATMIVAFAIRDVSLWRVVYAVFPAGGAIRAVTRVAVHLLVPASIGVVIAAETILASRRRWIVAALLVVIVAEQYVPNSAYAWAPIVEREAALAIEVQQAAASGQCRAFVYTPAPSPCVADEAWGTKHARAMTAHLDAMWASTLSGIPTVNGYTATLPRGYGFWATDYCRPDDEATIRAAIASWCADRGCDAATVCWVR
jgi:hypothetical protein